MSVLSDVFTVEEIARAAGVPRDAVDAVIEAGSVRPLPGTAFFEPHEAIRAGIEARRVVAAGVGDVRDPDADIFTTANRNASGVRRKGLPSFASSLVHGVFIVTMLWLTSGAPESCAGARSRAATRVPHDSRTRRRWWRGWPAQPAATSKSGSAGAAPHAATRRGCVARQIPAQSSSDRGATTHTSSAGADAGRTGTRRIAATRCPRCADDQRGATRRRSPGSQPTTRVRAAASTVARAPGAGPATARAWERVLDQDREAALAADPIAREVASRRRVCCVR